MKKIAIAIDGPAGAGKSSVAKEMSKSLNYLYIDTGAMYRSVTWAVLKEKVDINDLSSMEALLESLHLEMELTSDGPKLKVLGRDVTKLIRSQEVNELVSKVATLEPVRAYLVKIQRKLAAQGGIILDGRDIGSVVLPKAELKVFLTASVDARVARRWEEVKGKEGFTMEAIRANVIERDYMDEHRPISPLVCVEDAVVVDSSDLTFQETVNTMVKLAMEKITND